MSFVIQKKTYIFGGVPVAPEMPERTIRFFNEVVVLNVNDLTWSYGSLENAPYARLGYTATLLSDGRIVYIGGVEQVSDGVARYVNINQINLYNTKLDTWSEMVGAVLSMDYDIPIVIIPFRTFYLI